MSDSEQNSRWTGLPSRGRRPAAKPDSGPVENFVLGGGVVGGWGGWVGGEGGMGGGRDVDLGLLVTLHTLTWFAP